ncbi:hypothetical protein L1887_19676 [Cichorium endivia]|nr:hypothetical protein L1887_19676 [Cichorium endivia]
MVWTGSLRRGKQASRVHKGNSGATEVDEERLGDWDEPETRVITVFSWVEDDAQARMDENSIPANKPFLH